MKKRNGKTNKTRRTPGYGHAIKKIKSFFLTNTLLFLAFLIVALIIQAPLFFKYLQYFQMKNLSYSWDSYTHYLRIKHARDFFIPSGHRWGWDPFWFQGYSPFLIYAHFHYMALAALSLLFGLNLITVFNIASVVAVVALPILVGFFVTRMSGAFAGILGVVLSASINCLYGGGPFGTLLIGLFSQQIGLCFFVAFFFYTICRRNLKWGSFFLGVTWLFHVHSGLVAALFWFFSFLIHLACEKDKKKFLKLYFFYSITAVAISLPTTYGIVIGLDKSVQETGFGFPSMWSAVVNGDLGLQWPLLLGLFLGLFFLVITRQEMRVKISVLLVFFVFAIALQQLVLDIPVLDKILRQILRLRTLPFAYLSAIFILLLWWKKLSSYFHWALIFIFSFGILKVWGQLEAQSSSYAQPYLEGEEMSETTENFEKSLAWIKNESSNEQVSTILMPFEPLPDVTHPIHRLVDVLELPALGGHGIELTNIHNSRLLFDVPNMSCEEIVTKMKKFAIGYVFVGDPTLEKKFAECLQAKPAWSKNPWSVFKTNHHWANFTPDIVHFDRDKMWTSLTWQLDSHSEKELTLPIANFGGWKAMRDGVPVKIQFDDENLISIPTIEGTKTIELKYVGFSGEWLSVFVSCFCMLAIVFSSFLWRGKLPHPPVRTEA